MPVIKRKVGGTFGSKLARRKARAGRKRTENRIKRVEPGADPRGSVLQGQSKLFDEVPLRQRIGAKALPPQEKPKPKRVKRPATKPSGRHFSVKVGDKTIKVPEAKMRAGRKSGKSDTEIATDYNKQGVDRIKSIKEGMDEKKTTTPTSKPSKESPRPKMTSEELSQANKYWSLVKAAKRSIMKKRREGEKTNYDTYLNKFFGQGVTPMKIGGKIGSKLAKKAGRSKPGRRAIENREKEYSPRTKRDNVQSPYANPTARKKAKVAEAKKGAKKAKRGVQPDKVKALKKRLKPKGVGTAQRGWGKTGKH